jgi:hypothetical protein
MNARTSASLLVLAVLSLGATLLPAQVACAEKPSRMESRQEGEDLRKATRQEQGRAPARPVKQQAAPSQGGGTAGARRQDPGPRVVPAAPVQGRESRGAPAPRVPLTPSLASGQGRGTGRSRSDDRNAYVAGSRERHDGAAGDERRPPSTYVPNRDRAGDSRQPYDSSRQGYDSSRQRYDSSHQRYDSSRSRYASARHHYVPPRTVHHHYPARRYYYPPRGYVAPALPRNVVIVHHRHYDYWYGGGVWYRPYGARYVVVTPPLGVFVSVLPTYYSTFWYGGIPYYYANDAYYVWREPQRAYEVVAPPADAAATVADPVTEDIFVYPREGQGEEQVAFDRYECHRWASDETGFDPTQPWGGVAQEQAGALREAYLRAMTACLEGRGYSVR